MRNLKSLAVVVTALVVIDAAWTPAVLGSAALFPKAYMASVAPIATSVDNAALATKIVTMIVFALWLYLAGRNVAEAGLPELQFTPAARVWWFLVPFACLFKPFEGMRELWNASQGHVLYRENDPRLSVWWALWLAHNAIGFVTTLGPTGFWIAGGIGIALAVVALTIVWRITKAQAGGLERSMAEVFA